MKISVTAGNYSYPLGWRGKNNCPEPHVGGLLWPLLLLQLLTPFFSKPGVPHLWMLKESCGPQLAEALGLLSAMAGVHNSVAASALPGARASEALWLTLLNYPCLSGQSHSIDRIGGKNALSPPASNLPPVSHWQDLPGRRAAVDSWKLLPHVLILSINSTSVYWASALCQIYIKHGGLRHGQNRQSFCFTGCLHFNRERKKIITCMLLQCKVVTSIKMK